MEVKWRCRGNTLDGMGSTGTSHGTVTNAYMIQNTSGPQQINTLHPTLIVVLDQYYSPAVKAASSSHLQHQD